MTISAFSQSSRIPFWVDHVTSVPEGYVTDAEGNVEISTAEGLAWLISVVNGLNGCIPDDFDGRTVKLISDIRLDANGERRFTPIGNRTRPFKGTFDGDHRLIDGMIIHYSQNDGDTLLTLDMGMFGCLRHGTVKNVVLNTGRVRYNSILSQGWYQAALVAVSDSLSLVDDCTVSMNEVSFTNGAVLVGLNRNSTVRNCAADLSDPSPLVSVAQNGAGVVMRNLSEGGYADAEVLNCYFYGNMLGSYSVENESGIVCFNETAAGNNGKKAVVRNCYAELLGDLWVVRTMRASWLTTRWGVSLSTVMLISPCATNIRRTCSAAMLARQETAPPLSPMKTAVCCKLKSRLAIKTPTVCLRP